MSLENWVTVAVGLGSLVVGATTLSHTLKNNRGKKYLENLEGLHKTEELLASWGALEGREASGLSNEIHQNTLASLNREKRLNAVFYLDSVSRLSRPGTSRGLFLVIYAVIMLAPVFNGAFPVTDAMSQRDRLSTIVTLIIWLFIALTLGMTGCRQLWRRLKTRKLVKNMGMVDPLTVEGVKLFLRDLRKLVRGGANASRTAKVSETGGTPSSVTRPDSDGRSA
jgi:hypothetical protein